MVVRVLVVLLDNVVVHVLCRQLRLDPVQSHGVEFEHHQGPGGVLGEGLVDADADWCPGRHLALDEV